MAPEEFKRKLTAILSADVEGYSRLMGEDEDATIRTLTSYRELMSTLIQKHRGRVVDSPGDNLLAEFGSVVDAVRCAVEIQEELRVRNAELPEERKMVFRIGINLGDVVEEGERIYGDGINIAARVEGLAEGGGICISGSVYDSIKNKLSLSYQSLGEHTVKNITEPVRVYRMRVGPEAVARKEAGPKRWRWTALAGVAALIIVIGAVAIWNFYLRRPSVEAADPEKMAFPLPEKPSIAVLPFENMSGDSEQQFIADGITESIITGLFKTPEIFVIARNSVFKYKGKPVEIRQVSEDLGVRYVLEGSVQKEGDRLRINAQLIDAIEGHHLWAEKYDRHLKDLFAIQDEITMKVITELQVKLTEGEYARVLAKGTDNIEAYLKCLNAIQLLRRMTKEDNLKSRKICEEVIALDPNFPMPYTYMGFAYHAEAIRRWGKAPKESLARAEELARKAIELHDSSGLPNRVLANVFAAKRQWDKALEQAELSVSLDPNVQNLYGLAMILRYAGRHEESIEWSEKAFRLDPITPAIYLNSSGHAYFLAERYEDALTQYKRVLEIAKKGEFNLKVAHLSLARTYAMLGQVEKAGNHVKEVLRVDPKSSISRRAKILSKLYKNPTDVDRILNAWRKAGLPEKPPLPIPDKPSIAVLPFVNMSEDPKQEYFSDGITEQIITALSKSPELFVISRSSTFTYKGKSVKAQQVSRDLGVKYVLEGSVQKSGDRLRITAQLIDAIEDRHLWAERYDRELKDIFALQDEITVKIASALRVKLVTGGEVAAQNAGSGTKNLQAYLKHLEAARHLARGTPEDYALARKLSEEAIALDPEYPPPYSILAWTHIMDTVLGRSKSRSESLGKAFKLGQKVLDMNESDASGHAILGNVYGSKGEHEKAIAEFERVVFLDPNRAKGYMSLAFRLIIAGRPQEAIPLLKKSMRLSPLSQTHASMCLFRLGMAYRTMGQYEEALSALKKAVDIRPNFFGIRREMAAIYIYLGREEEARAAAAEVRRILPKFSLERFAKRRSIYKDKAEWERYIDALRKSGLK